ncbi:MAG: hypothetical protein A3I78_10690 [Gammaproteobacteria bacterium RIFCSPLOWO2_02_FULL_56_15]|nr:MAG: hypothetical protein A3I78_10690 [Gammaproteobacteria bacterium RIFCSPLOWO2_02_FULL_56_15]
MANPGNLISVFLFLSLVMVQPETRAHGSVTAEKDLCVIKIGYFKAHFKIYLPHARQQQEFCEDIPDTGESVFVMEYIHGDLGMVPIDFRIIRNVTGLGTYARLEDIALIEDIESVTVFYQPPAVEPDVFTSIHQFDEPGEYLGIVTAKRQDTGQIYSAVFPFAVGFIGYGYLPLFIVLALIIQLSYWLMKGGWSRQQKQPIEPITSHLQADHG